MYSTVGLFWFFNEVLFYMQAGRNEHGSNDIQSFEELDCNINGEYTVGCRREGEEVYFPFSFLHKYFEVQFTVAYTFQDRSI